MSIANTSGVAFVCLLIGAQLHSSEAKGSMMTESLFDLKETQLHTAQGKITYLGEQKKPIPTVVFSPHSYPVVMDRFLAVQGSRDPYDNDTMPYTSFDVTPAELQRMLHSLKSLVLKADAGKTAPFLSFTLAREENGHIGGQEIRIGRASSKEFFKKLIDALHQKNDAARAALSHQATECAP